MDEDRRSNAVSQSAPSETVDLDAIPLHSTNLLTVLDPQGKIQYESPAIERVFGFSPESMIGDQVAEYFHPEDRERVIAAYQRVVSGDADGAVSAEYRHANADGTYVWVESVASANPTPADNYVINTRDISERKKREKQLQATNERLAAFASVVSHDLRNPLAVAAGNLELHRDKCDSDQLEAVAHAHDRMDALIGDLLSLARSGVVVEDVEPIEFAALVDSCWGTVSTGTATLETRIDRTIYADRSRLTQLLENLFGNAVEHGDVDVEITLGEIVGTDGADGFYVADNGPGVPEGDRDRVLERGVAPGSTGTGLGLAIVERIASAHGWDVEITESRTGGARFEFTGIDFQ